MSFRDILDMDLFRGVQSLINGAFVSECDIVGSDGRSGGRGSDVGSIVVLIVLISIAVLSLVAYVVYVKMKSGGKNVSYRSVSGTQEERDHLSDSECAL